jgi:hypothetical protein
VTRFLRRSGLVAWDRGALSPCRLDEEFCRLLHVVALLEEDTAISTRQARSLGIDRDSDIAAFLPSWEREEAEHARALRFLLAQQTYCRPPRRSTAIPLRRRAVALVPASPFRRLPQTGLVYSALGAAAEYVTIVTYTEFARSVEQPAVAALLRAIARQEGRHFAFFLAAARVRAEAMSSLHGRLARRALASLWEPVGVPSLGLPAWRRVFARLLERADFRARVQRMDHVVDSIPHLAGLQLMTTFMREEIPSP